MADFSDSQNVGKLSIDVSAHDEQLILNAVLRKLLTFYHMVTIKSFFITQIVLNQSENDQKDAMLQCYDFDFLLENTKQFVSKGQVLNWM